MEKIEMSVQDPSVFQERQDPWMNAETAAVHMATTPAKMAHDRCLGRGPLFYKWGRKILYKRSDLDSFLEQFALDPTKKKRA